MNDSNSSPPNERDLARQKAHKLRLKPGWDTRAFQAQDPLQKLRELDAAHRGDQAYQGSTECKECLALRQDSGDDTALCDTHLAQAMGF